MRTLSNPGSLSPDTAGFFRPGNGTILFPIAKTLCVVHCLFLFSLVSLKRGSGKLSSPFLCYLYLSCSPLLRSFNSNPTFSLSYWHCYKSSLLSLRKQTSKQTKKKQPQNKLPFSLKYQNIIYPMSGSFPDAPSLLDEVFTLSVFSCLPLQQVSSPGILLACSATTAIFTSVPSPRLTSLDFNQHVVTQ